MDAVRAFAAASGFVFAGWLSLGVAPVTPVLAQAIGVPTATSPSESLPEFAVRQGGAFAILALVLFYYRRDYRELTADKQADRAKLVDLVAAHATTMTEMSSALRENNQVIREMRVLMIRSGVVPDNRVDRGRE